MSTNVATLLFCVCLFVGINAFPQAELHQLLSSYKKSAVDTNRVKLLLEITSIYLYKKARQYNHARQRSGDGAQAKVLSEKLEFKSGIETAIFYIADSYSQKRDHKSARAVMKIQADHFESAF